MRCLKTLKNPTDRKVYDFIIKKENEGKAKRVVNSLTSGILHASPMEHPAQAVNTTSYSNFDNGWMQYRKFKYGADA